MEKFETLQLTFKQGKVNVNFRCDYMLDVLKSVCLHILQFIDKILIDKVKMKFSNSTLDRNIKVCKFHLEILTRYQCEDYSDLGRLTQAELKTQKWIIIHMKRYFTLYYAYYLAKNRYTREEIKLREASDKKNRKIVGTVL